MTGAFERQRQIERWTAIVRLLTVPFAILQAAVTGGYPEGTQLWVWLTTGLLAAGALVLLRLSRLDLDERSQRLLGLAALTFDAGIVFSYVLAFNFVNGTPVRQLLFLPLLEAAARYGIVAPFVVAAATVPVLIGFELLRRANVSHYQFRASFVTLQLGIEFLAALLVGWLVRLLGDETRVASARAREAEQLRDELGRRVDALEATNRCARALASSLDLEQSFGAFIRELKGLVPFDRVAIVLAEGHTARVIATGGVGGAEAFPPGSEWPLQDSVTSDVLGGETVLQRDLETELKTDVEALVAVGLRSRLAAPLLVASRAIGMLSLSRRERDAFDQSEVELVTLLGRLVGTSVQNIRAYELEHQTVEELRRLSALRADFVSLVSHELRSPMAAVIGAAQTLEQRWRELTPEQRSSFLALIADETSRLATLIADVMDTSRIEAGTFSYSFGEVDMAELVLESTAAAQLGQDEVEVETRLRTALPPVHGDRTRLKQVLVNLIDNAIKYSPAGGTVTVSAGVDNGSLMVDISDRGPGIAAEHQNVIFEKFERLHAAGSGKPGTGLGLFIARSIAEAHGGSVTVRSSPPAGATFRLELPVH